MKRDVFSFLIVSISTLVLASCSQRSAQPDRSHQLALDSLKKQSLHVQDSLAMQLEYCRQEAERVTEQYEALLVKTANKQTK